MVEFPQDTTAYKIEIIFIPTDRLQVVTAELSVKACFHPEGEIVFSLISHRKKIDNYKMYNIKLQLHVFSNVSIENSKSESDKKNT